MASGGKPRDQGGKEVDFERRGFLGKVVGGIGAALGFTDDQLNDPDFDMLQALGATEQGLGFMTGGITFCSMLPMRSIPFLVDLISSQLFFDCDIW